MSSPHVAGWPSEGPTAAQIKEFFAQISSGRITKARMQGFLRGEDDLPDLDWARVYDVLGMSAKYKEKIGNIDMSGLTDFWIVPLLEGVTSNKIVTAMRRLGITVHIFTCELDDAEQNDIDWKMGVHFRLFKKTVEADPNLANLSANDCTSRGVSGITLTERLLLGLGYFLVRDRHLDEKNKTLCAGSRHSSGRVPAMSGNLGDRTVYVDWFSPDSRYPELRARSAA